MHETGCDVIRMIRLHELVTILLLVASTTTAEGGINDAQSGKRDAETYADEQRNMAESISKQQFVAKRSVPIYVGDANEPLVLQEETESLFDDAKRNIPMFVGKRDVPVPMFLGKKNVPMFVGKKSNIPMFVGKRKAPMFVGKKSNIPMFVGKRKAPMFVGKRNIPMFVGKRNIPMFVGKRNVPMFVGKRNIPMFLGKRNIPMFLGKRESMNSLPSSYAMSVRQQSNDDRMEQALDEEYLEELVEALRQIAIEDVKEQIRNDKRRNGSGWVGKRSDELTAQQFDVERR